MRAHTSSPCGFVRMHSTHAHAQSKTTTSTTTTTIIMMIVGCIDVVIIIIIILISSTYHFGDKRYENMLLFVVTKEIRIESCAGLLIPDWFSPHARETVHMVRSPHKDHRITTHDTCTYTHCAEFDCFFFLLIFHRSISLAFVRPSMLEHYYIYSTY